MKSVVILLTAHKPELSSSEKASLKQCFKVLGKYRVVLVCPKGLNVTEYRDIMPSLEFDFIHPRWHSSLRMFNRMKVEPLLYRKYRAYEYILFYELDAWVFRDELEYWCDQDYDYIGAPWYEGLTKATENSKFMGVGNGGFSLRKVKSHLRVLRSFGYIKKPALLWEEFTKDISIKALGRLVSDLTIRNNTFYTFNNWNRNDDIFWGMIVPGRFEWFKVAGLEAASRFSMEVNAPSLYQKNGGQLPFGCHKWEAYHLEFWRQFIHKDQTSNNESLDENHTV